MDTYTLPNREGRADPRFSLIREARDALIDVDVRGAWLLRRLDDAQRHKDAADAAGCGFDYVRQPFPDEGASTRRSLELKRASFPPHLEHLVRAYDGCHEAERDICEAIERSRVAVDEAAVELDCGVENPLEIPTVEIRRVLDEIADALMSPVDGSHDPTEGAEQRAELLRSALTRCTAWHKRLRPLAGQGAGTTSNDDSWDARAKEFNRIAGDLRRFSARFERIAIATAKHEHAVANIADNASAVGRLLWKAADAGAFAAEDWWVGGAARYVLDWVGGSDTKQRGGIGDSGFAHFWSFAVGSWIRSRWQERLRRNAGDLDWVHRRVTNRGIEVVEAQFDEADLKDRHEQRAWVYADACRVVADEIEATASARDEALIERVADIFDAWRHVVERTNTRLGAAVNNETAKHLHGVRERQQCHFDDAVRFACEGRGRDDRDRLGGAVADGVRAMESLVAAVLDNNADHFREAATAAGKASGAVRSLASGITRPAEPMAPDDAPPDPGPPERPIEICEAAKAMPKRSNCVLNKLRRDGARIDESARPKTVELEDLLRSYPRLRKRLRAWADKKYPAEA